LRTHHLGKSFVNNLAVDIEEQFAALLYTGEGRRWNFKQYVSRHVELHARAKELERFGYAGIDKASRVRRLMAGIKTSKLDSVKGSIFTQGEDVQNNFEAVVLAYTNFIAIPLKATVRLLLLPVRMTQTAAAATARTSVLRDRSHR
jgi:hypothetical protein